MMASKDIPWFNPRQMNAETVLKLSTGRETLLHDFFILARQRHREPAAGRHWLVTGPRGAGKSFFLCLVQAMWPKVMASTATFVLLPEELPNVYAPHEWLREVQRLLPGQPRSKGHSPTWQSHEKDEAAAWDAALSSLREAFTGTLLVIGVENFDMLLQQAFDSPVRASRLRSLMENEPRIMLLGSAVEGEFDEAYEKRLFRQFEHHPMPRWDENDHRDYLTRRAQLIGKDPSPRQLARIDAYSRFTGGSARVAAVLASAILDEQDPVSASADLTATLDRMSDYYRSLIDKIPANTRKVFDALIRGGEPASQVELAARVHARQNDISRAFRWLVDYGYVANERQPSSREHSYRVNDRLFVQFYRMRYVDPDQPCQLAILADLLATTIEFRHKWHFAEGYLDSAKPAEAEFMAKLACSERGVDVMLLPEDMQNAASLVELGKEWLWMDTKLSNGGGTANFITEALRRFKTDQEMSKACEQVRNLAYAALKAVGAEKLITRLEQMPLSPVIRYQTFATIVREGTKETRSNFITRFEKMADALEAVFHRIESNVVFFGSLAELGKEYPLAYSLTDSATAVREGRKSTEAVSNQQAAEWAARAICCWVESGRPELAADPLMFCEHFVFNLLSEDYSPEAAIQILEPLSAILDRLDSKDAYKACRLTGIVLTDLSRFSEAAEAFKMGIEYADPGPLSSVDCRERMAWCQGSLGLLNESIQNHRIALSAWQGSVMTERQAYNLGQIARHMCQLESLESALAFARLNKSANPDDLEVTVEQLGEAVWDIWRLSGEAAAFQFGRRLLAALEADLELSSKKMHIGIWFRMVDVGVPLALLEDLISEAENILPETQHKKVFLDTLRAWIEFIKAKPDERHQVLRRLDPDSADMVQSFSKELSPQTRHLYSLPAPVDPLKK